MGVTFTDSDAVGRVFVVNDFLYQLVVTQLPHSGHHLWTLNTADMMRRHILVTFRITEQINITF